MKFIMIKGEIYQNKTPFLNMYVHNNKDSKLTNKMAKLKRKTKTFTTLTGDFIISLHN